MQREFFFPCLFQSYRAAGCTSPHQWAGQSLCNISCTCLQMHGRNTSEEGDMIKKEAFCCFFTAWWMWSRTGLMWQLQQRNVRPCCSPDLLLAQAQGKPLAGDSVSSKSALKPGSLLSWPRTLSRDWQKSWKGFLSRWFCHDVLISEMQTA